jgi:hypothetical protein
LWHLPLKSPITPLKFAEGMNIPGRGLTGIAGHFRAKSGQIQLEGDPKDSTLSPGLRFNLPLESPTMPLKPAKGINIPARGLTSLAEPFRGKSGQI